MSKNEKAIGSTDRVTEQYIKDLQMALHLPDAKKKAIVANEIEELLREQGPEAVLAGKMATIQHYKDQVDNYRIKADLLQDEEYLCEQDMEKVRDLQHEIFKIGSEICFLNGSIPSLDTNDPLVEEAKELSQDLPMVEVVGLARSVSGSCDGCFGEYTFRPSHQITLKGFEDGTVTLTRADIKSLLWFFEFNKLL